MVIIITKVLCYHQVYIADELYKIYGQDFAFIQMREPLDWRVANKQEGFVRPYLYSYSKTPSEVKELIKNADVLIFGEAPLKLIRLRKKDCLLMKMSENIFKESKDNVSFFGKIKRFVSYKYLKLLTNNAHSYLLSSSGFAYRDYYKLGIFKNRSLKWGYFPYIPHIERHEIKNKYFRQTIELVWISRLVGYKNPLCLIELVKHLNSKGILNYHITVVGNSDESDVDYFSILKSKIEDMDLSKWILLIGKIPSDKVFEYYKNANIALFTADKSEGWSVGINEAMSCGCVIVTSNTIGAAPFLIENNDGVVFKYDSVNDFCCAVEKLLNNRDKLFKIAFSNFEKIHNIWNYKNASKNLSIVIDGYLKDKTIRPVVFGPCSVANIIDYDWYKKR